MADERPIETAPKDGKTWITLIGTRLGEPVEVSAFWWKGPGFEPGWYDGDDSGNDPWSDYEFTHWRPKGPC